MNDAETPKKILIIGRHPGIMSSIIDLLTGQGYNATGRFTNAEAIAAFKSENFDAVVIGGGVDAESRQLFHATFTAINSAIKMIDAHPATILSDLESAFK